MLHSNVWSGSSTLSPICFAFKWASIFLRFYFSQAVTPVVRAAVINSLKSALHQSERNLHIPSLLKFLSVLWRKTAPQTQSKHQKSQFPAGPEVLLHFSEPFSVFFIVPVQHLPVLRWGVICHSHLCYPSFSLSLTLLSLLSSVLFALSSYFQQLLVGEWPLTFSACSLLSPLFLGSLLQCLSLLLLCCSKPKQQQQKLPTNQPPMKIPTCSPLCADFLSLSLSILTWVTPYCDWTFAWLCAFCLSDVSPCPQMLQTL